MTMAGSIHDNTEVNVEESEDEGPSAGTADAQKVFSSSCSRPQSYCRLRVKAMVVAMPASGREAFRKAAQLDERQTEKTGLP